MGGPRAGPPRPAGYHEAGGAGTRPARALDQCHQAVHAIVSHLAGGSMAWKAAGLPTVSLDAATGAVRSGR